MLTKIVKSFTSKKNYFAPKKCEILVLNEIFFYSLKKIIKNKNIEYINFKFDQINLYVFLRVIISGQKINFFNYLKFYIKLSKCKIIITGSDNYILFYRLKDLFPEKKIISIQNGFRNYLFFKELNKFSSLKADYIFTFNKSFCKLYEKSISAKVLPLGSFKNNMIKINKTVKKNTILFISSGYPGGRDGGKSKYYEFYKSIKIEKTTFHKPDEILFKNISDYCEKNKINLEFITRGRGQDSKKEIEFFKKLTQNESIIYHYRPYEYIDHKYKIYNFSDKYSACVSTHSSIGIENLARGNRTAIFNNKTIVSKNVMNLFWNYNIPLKGPFWSNDISFDEVKRILDFVVKSKDEDWMKKSKEVTEEFMIYERNNEKLLKILDSNSD